MRVLRLEFEKNKMIFKTFDIFVRVWEDRLRGRLLTGGISLNSAILYLHCY